MTTDFRALCADLVDDLEMADWPWKLKESFRADIQRARAALAEPEPPHRCIYSPSQIAECGGPCQQGPEHCDCGELWVTEPEPKEPTSRQLMMLADDMGMTSVGDAAEYARAVLARWGNHPGSSDRSGNLKAGLTRSPAAGEVAELVAWLRATAETLHEGNIQTPRLTRAADLLERLSPPRLAAEPPPPEQGQAFKDADTGVIYVRDGDQWLATQPVPQPVPVSERLPEPGDCDMEGRCWTWAIGTWRLSRINRSFHTHWLPAHTLPLPS